LTIGQIIEQILPVLFYSAIFTCYQEAFKLELESYLASNFEYLVEKAIKVSRNNDAKKYQVIYIKKKKLKYLISFFNKTLRI
jgi:hypothetical protein